RKLGESNTRRAMPRKAKIIDAIPPEEGHGFGNSAGARFAGGLCVCDSFEYRADCFAREQRFPFPTDTRATE
ncbi:MAG: hypothetical protein ABSG54_18940, partial [Terriglobia bacterium]